MTQTRGAAYFLGDDKPATETRARPVLSAAGSAFLPGPLLPSPGKGKEIIPNGRGVPADSSLGSAVRCDVSRPVLDAGMLPLCSAAGASPDNSAGNADRVE